MTDRTKAQRDADLDRFFAAAEDILTDWEPALYGDAHNTEYAQEFRFDAHSPEPLGSWAEFVDANLAADTDNLPERVEPALVAMANDIIERFRAGVRGPLRVSLHTDHPGHPNCRCELPAVPPVEVPPIDIPPLQFDVPGHPGFVFVYELDEDASSARDLHLAQRDRDLLQLRSMQFWQAYAPQIMRPAAGAYFNPTIQ